MIRVVSTPSRTQKVATVDHNLHRRAPFAANDDADVLDFDGPASAPTILVEIEAIAIPTALPAPPLMPALAGIDGSSSLRTTRPNIFLVPSAAAGTMRRTTRPMAMATTLQLLEGLRPSTPPTSPPPPMRRAA